MHNDKGARATPGKAACWQLQMAEEENVKLSYQEIICATVYTASTLIVYITNQAKWKLGTVNIPESIERENIFLNFVQLIHKCNFDLVFFFFFFPYCLQTYSNIIQG